MRTVLIVALVVLPGCSILFDGSKYVGDASVDAAAPDAAYDSGPHVCEPACPTGSYCAASGCALCDGDHDGFLAHASCAGAALIDCNDADPAIHPGAVPVCGDGIDQSCGTMGPVGFATDEIGFFAAQNVMLATGTLPTHVRVFGRTPAEAIVLFRDEADASRRVAAADVPLVDTAQTVSATRWLEYIGESEMGMEKYRYDAVRDSAGQIHVALLREVSSNELHVLDTLVPDTGSPTTMETHPMMDPTTLSLTSFATTGDPALVRSGATSLALGQPASAVSMGTTDQVVVAIGVNDGHFSVLGHGGAPTPPWSAASSGTAAAFAGPSGDLLLWNGSLGSGTVDELAHLSAGAVGRPTLAQLMPPSMTEQLTAIIAPVTDGFDLYAQPYDATMPWSAGGPGSPDGHFAATLPVDPHLSAFSVGPAQLAIMYGPPMAMASSDLMFAFVDTHATDIVPYMMVAPGVAQIVDTAMDVVLVAHPTGAHPMAIEITVIYAYVRHISAMPATLYVGGVHVCGGFGGI